MVLTLPAIIVLKRAFPESEIFAVASKSNKDLLGLLPFDVNVVEGAKFPGIIRKLRKEKIDIGIDFVMDWKNGNPLLLNFSHIEKKIGFCYPLRRFFIDFCVKPEKKIPILRQNFFLLKELGVNMEMGFPIDGLRVPEAEEKADVVIHPGGFYPSQRWPVEHFMELAKKIKAKTGLRVALIGGQSDLDILERLRRHFPKFLYLVNEPPLKVAAIMKKARLFIGNNSGPLHLACALGVPTISFLGPTNPWLFYPQGEKNFVFVKDLPCIGCGKAKCRRHLCMDLISPEEVWRKVREFL